MKKIQEELRRMGKKRPELLLQKLEAVELSRLEFLIMKLRYVDGWDFKLIPHEVSIGDRWMYRVHQKALKKTVAKLNLVDLLEMLGQ